MGFVMGLFLFPTHGASSYWQPTVLLLFYQSSGEGQGCADVLGSQIVLALDFLESHAARQAADHDGDRRARGADHWFAVAYSWINNNALFDGNLDTPRSSPPVFGTS